MNISSGDRLDSPVSGSAKTDAVFIFDFDGVLVDSIAVLYQAYIAFAKENGILGTKEEFDRLNGPNLDEIVEYFIDIYSLPAEPEQLKERYLQLLATSYESVEIKSGIKQILNLLSELDVPLAIATSGNRREVESVLHRLGLRGYFSVVVTGNEIAKSKPSPDIFLVAKEKVGIDKANYFVVEDSDLGIDAAKAAGCIPIKLGEAPSKNCEHWIQRVDQLKDLISRELNCAEIVFRSAIVHLRVDFQKPLEPTPDHKAEKIRQLWARAKKNNLGLTNSPVLFLTKCQDYDGDFVLDARIGEYSQAFAQSSDISLKTAPALAVSAYVVDCVGYTLIGNRGPRVTEYKNYLEFVPSGGLSAENARTETASDAVIKEQVKVELYEEAGIKDTEIRAISVLGGVLDKLNNVFDIVCRVDIRGQLSQSRLLSEEYQNLNVVARPELEQMLAYEQFTPTSRCLAEIILAEES